MDKPRILVVDDTDHVRDMLVDMLALDGFEVAGSAASGPEAVELAGKVSADVIVMDYKMPRQDGLETAREIRAANPDQPIILYSAYLDPGLERQARAAGIALCLGKAQGLSHLERHITEMCRSLSG